MEPSSLDHAPSKFTLMILTGREHQKDLSSSLEDKPLGLLLEASTRDESKNSKAALVAREAVFRSAGRWDYNGIAISKFPSKQTKQ